MYGDQTFFKLDDNGNIEIDLKLSPIWWIKGDVERCSFVNYDCSKYHNSLLLTV